MVVNTPSMLNLLLFFARIAGIFSVLLTFLNFCSEQVFDLCKIGCFCLFQKFDVKFPSLKRYISDC